MAQETQKKIGELLLEKGYVDETQLRSALDIQGKTGKKLGLIFVESGVITEDQLVEVVSERLRIPKINLSSLVINPQTIAVIPVDVARRYLAIPVFKMGNILTVAMADPLNAIALDEIKYLTKCLIKRSVAGEKEISEAIERYYSVADSVRQIIGDQADDHAPADKKQLLAGDELTGGDSTVIRIVNLLLTRAIHDGASDVHFEPDDQHLRVRYRVHGAMREEAASPKKMQAEIISRIKIAADLDVSEKRLPQDGRMSLAVDNCVVDMRVSTLPTIHGEKVVIRILDKRSLRAGLTELGMHDELLESWRQHIRRPEGLVLISGPTSSGKTSTLYASLQEINNIEKNIITVEDPVEFSLQLINQVQINEKAGLSFASALRSILRQNPDIIMIGEIRDLETAAIAVRASLTGHLVFSTIHTNDSPSAVTRLTDMGIERYMVASALEAVLAQRLVRTICPECTEAARPSDSVLQRVFPDGEPTGVQLSRGTGCLKCRGTGFSGQTAIYELLGITDAIRDLILAGEAEAAIAAEASRSGFRPLFHAGLALALSGRTTLDEVLRVTSPVETGIRIPMSPAVRV